MSNPPTALNADIRQVLTSSKYGTSPEDVAACLMEELVDEFGSAKLKPLPINLSNLQAKWRALSSLQKAVRRGFPENATRMASALINFGEADHLFKRLPVIALEDVAFADPVLCAKIVLISTSKKVRAQLGGDACCLPLIERMAEGVKDRLPNEVVVSAAADPALNDYKKALHALPSVEVQRLALNGNWQEKITAMRLLCGTLKVGDEFLSDHRSVHEFRRAFADAPPLIRYMGSKLASSGEGATLSAGMKVCWDLLYGEDAADPIFVKDADVEDTGVTRSILLPALDVHTQEGKRAVQRLLKHTEEGADFWEWATANDADPALAFAMGLFNVEGKVCDQRLWSDDIEKIEAESRHSQVARSCLPRGLVDTMCDRVVSLLPVLNELRRDVLKG